MGCCVHDIAATRVTKHDARFLRFIDLAERLEDFVDIRSGSGQIREQLVGVRIGLDVRDFSLAVKELERSLVVDDRVISEVAGHRAAGHERRHSGRDNRLRTLRLNGGRGFIYHHQGAAGLVENNFECRIHFLFLEKEVNSCSLVRKQILLNKRSPPPPPLRVYPHPLKRTQIPDVFFEHSFRLLDSPSDVVVIAAKQFVTCRQVETACFGIIT